MSLTLALDTFIFSAVVIFSPNFIIVIKIINFSENLREEKIAPRTMWQNHYLILKQKKRFCQCWYPR